MTTLAELGIKVTTDDIKGAVRELDALGQRSKQTESAVGGLQATWSKFSGIIAATGIATVGRELVGTIAEFEKMQASLKTVTGSAEGAVAAMDLIRDFAKETPFQVSEITDAFIKLKALGLDPSEDSLRSFGNTASAMGKPLNQMIEAVADAATGEFERLKEFGVKARSEGDNVTFTFQGVSTEVKKNADEIQEYLKGIGDVQFAGAMSEQMNTISGMTSNLSDSFDSLMVEIGEEGLKGAIKDSLSATQAALADVTPHILGFTSALFGTLEPADELSEKTKIFSTMMLVAVEAVNQLTTSLSTVFMGTLETVGGAIGGLAAAVVALFEGDFKAAADITKEVFNDVGDSIMTGSEELNNELTGDMEDTIDKIAKIWDKNKRNIKEGKATATIDVGVNKPKDEGLSATEQKELDKLKATLEKRVEMLRKGMRDETQVAIEEEMERQNLLNEAEEQGVYDKEILNQLRLESAIRLDEELRAIEDERIERQREQREAEFEEQSDYFERLFNLESGSWRASIDFADAMRKQDYQSALKNGSLMLATVSKNNKEMFEVQKTLALANAAVTLPSAVIKSFEAGGGYPWGLIPAGLMLAQGLSQINAISSASFGGGGRGASVGGGGSSSPSAPVSSGLPPGSTAIPSGREQTAQPVRVVNVTLNGAGYSKDSVRELMQQINEQVGEGVELVAR
jgi:hypothetical protein